MQDCPHCYMRVMPKGDGGCPSCGENVEVPPDHGANKKRVTLSATEAFPDLCVVCGEAASKRRAVSLAEETNSATNRAVSGLSFAFLGPLMGLLTSAAGTKTWNPRKVSVKVPACKGCKGALPEPLHADWDRSTLDVVVHERFAKQLRKARRQAKRRG